MTLYVTKQDYEKRFKKIISEEDLKLAQDKIDQVTFNRIVEIGFENLTDFQKEKVREAICYQAEYINKNGYNNEDNNEISSYSILDISVNVQKKDNNSKTKAELECMSEKAYAEIVKTGLTQRTWRYNG